MRWTCGGRRRWRLGGRCPQARPSPHVHCRPPPPLARGPGSPGPPRGPCEHRARRCPLGCPPPPGPRTHCHAPRSLATLAQPAHGPCPWSPTRGPRTGRAGPGRTLSGLTAAAGAGAQRWHYWCHRRPPWTPDPPPAACRGWAAGLGAARRPSPRPGLSATQRVHGAPPLALGPRLAGTPAGDPPHPGWRP